MFNRQHERVELNTDAVLRFAGQAKLVCKTLDVSLGGMKVASQEMKEMYPFIGSDCLVEFAVEILVGVVNKQFVVQLKARVVNGDPRGVGLKFEGVDEETLSLIEKLVVSRLHEEDLSTLRNKGGISIRAPYANILKTHLEEYILESVKEVFIAFLGIDVIPGPYVERPDFNDYAPPDTEVTGIILFNGALEGGVHLASPLHFAVKAAGAMLGEAGLELANEQEDEVWDALGEITNQIAGGIQTRMSSSLEDISLTAPNIVIGSNFRVNYSKNLSSVRKFFRTPFGPFFVECFFS
ncbi:MAG: chemotaxis protein CheX [Magnetococcales bacterium]|nr:chemotaxis protein CheX [Magnetococcales bacterium]